MAGVVEPRLTPQTINKLPDMKCMLCSKSCYKQVQLHYRGLLYAPNHCWEIKLSDSLVGYLLLRPTRQIDYICWMCFMNF